MREMLEQIRLKFDAQQKIIDTQQNSIDLLNKENAELLHQKKDQRMEISRLKVQIGKFTKAVEEAGKNDGNH